MEPVSAVAIRIKELCNEKKLHLHDLVKKSELPFPVTYSLLKREKNDLDTILALCKGFGISIEEFLDSDIFDK